MTPKRAYFAMLGSIVLLVILCFAATYFGYTMLVRQGNTLLDLKTQGAVLEKQSSLLAQAKRDIAEYQELESIAKTVVPQEKDQARTTLEIVELAKASGIEITSIDFPESLLGEAAKKNTKAKNVPTVDSNTTQLTPVENLKGVYAMEIRVESDPRKPIAYEQVLDYLRRLENNRRTAQVKDISINPNSEDRNLVSFTLTLNSYVKP